jgi:ankyrin repeat protein
MLGLMQTTSATKETPLMWASMRRHAPVSSALLEAHANPNTHDRYGITALIDAVMGQKAEIVEILAGHPGVDVNQQARPADRLCHMLALKISSPNSDVTCLQDFPA